MKKITAIITSAVLALLPVFSIGKGYSFQLIKNTGAMAETATDEEETDMATKGIAVFNQGGEDFTINDPNIADEFDATASYKAGECVYYQGNLYRFNKAHAAGAWNNGDVSQINLSGNIPTCSPSDLLQTDLNEVTKSGFYLVSDGRTYTNKPDGSTIGFLIVVNTGNHFKQVFISYTGDKVWARTGTGSWYMISNRTEDQAQVASNNLWAVKGSTYDLGYDGVTDLNNVTENGCYLMTDSHEYQHKPEDNSGIGFLLVMQTGGWVKQILIGFAENTSWVRRGKNNGTGWNDWVIFTNRSDDYFYSMKGSRYGLAYPGGPTEGLTDLNDVTETGCYLLYDEQEYSHKPEGVGNIGFLMVYQTGNRVIQFFYSWGMNEQFQRRGMNDGSSWTVWEASGTQYNALDEPDLNKATGKGWFLLYEDIEYTNKPVGFYNIGFLNVARLPNGWIIQLLYQFTGGKIYKRRMHQSGGGVTNLIEEWVEISGGGGATYNVTNNYTFPEYSNTYNVSASPQIRTDTNNYLASTGDTTDVTASIATMLNSTGVCRLGPGVFYIKDLEMPQNSAIIGSGSATEIHLIGSADGYAIKMGSNCTVKDLRMIGADSEPEMSATVGGRHGILWIGDYTEHQTAPLRGIISDVYIMNFSGGGITCYDTGYGTSNGLEVTNAWIWSCGAGLNISYWSEFHKFTNIRCAGCYYGCVNNGGNNIFVNCDFSGSKEYAMIMDNSQGQSPNNTHGSCVGCVFNHTESGGTANSGIGIAILNCESGFVFEGCQIFFSRIHLEDSDGITFMGCNFGYSNCDIEIVGGGTILFTGNMHQGQPTITVEQNQKVHFENCYVRSTGAEVRP